MVASLSVKIISPEDLKLDILPRKTRKAFLSLTKLGLFNKSGWYLAGGTALAIQLGHRQSVDLDFFATLENIKEFQIIRELLATNKWQTTYQEKNTIYGVFDSAKVSLIAYPFFTPSLNRLKCGNIQILLPEDIVAMKIIAISQRGKKRDFYDLYWYCQNCEPLENIINRAIEQYPGQEENLNHILKSLNYFADAENDPTPKIFFKVSWQEIKRFFRKEVKRLAEKLIGLK